jgi:hypothetical protein
MTAGRDPFAYRLSGVLLHIAVIILLYVFFLKLEFNGIFVFLFTALFAVHPAISHAVAWIPGRNDILLAFFILISLICLAGFFNGGKKHVLKLAAALLAAAAALFTKESALVMIAVLPAFMFLFCKNVSKKDYPTVFLTYFFIVCAYAALRFFALGGVASFAWFDIFKAVKSVFIYCEYLIIPLRIYLFPEKVPFDFWTFAACSAALIPLAVSFIFDLGRKKVILFGAFWFIAFLAPSFMSSDFIISLLPHRLYLAAAGFMLMFLELFSSLSKKIKPAGTWLALFLAAVIVLFGFLSYLQVKKFKDKYIYLAHALLEQPESEFLMLKMAKYYADEGLFEDAKNEAGKIKSRNGGYSVEYYKTLGYIYSVEGNYNNAAFIYERLLELFPEDEAALYNMGEIYFIQGRYAKALEYAEKLLKIRPGHKDFEILHAKIKAAANK